MSLISWSNKLGKTVLEKLCWKNILFYFFLPPINIIIIQKTFSVDVFPETFPKPTLVREVNVKYNAVMYASALVILLTGICNRFARTCIQPLLIERERRKIIKISWYYLSCVLFSACMKFCLIIEIFLVFVVIYIYRVKTQLR